MQKRLSTVAHSLAFEKAGYFSDLVESLHAVVWRADARTFQFTYVSQEAKQLLGYPTSQWITEHDFWPSHIHPEDREQAVTTCLDALKSRRRHEFEYRMLAADGSVVWVRDNVRILRKNGVAQELVGVLIDVTERKHAEIQSDLVLSLAFAISTAWDVDNAYRLILTKVCEIAGWDFGQVWVPDISQTRMVRGPAWHCRLPEAESFSRDNADHSFTLNEDLVGRVWASRQAVWTRDATRLPEFLRARAAKFAGLRAGVMVPILADQQVLGIIEFFSRENRPENERQLQLLVSMADQIGQLIKRKKSEEQLEHFFNLSVDMFVVAGFDEIIRRVNPAAESITGYSRDELIARPFMEFVHEHDREAARNELRELAHGRETRAFEVRVLCKDGRHVWTQWSGRPILQQQVIFAVGRDITEQKQSVNKLRASEEQQRLLVESVSDYAIFMLDPDGHIVSWNTGAELIKGYRAEDILGRHFSVFYPEEDRRQDKPAQVLEIARREGRFQEEGWRLRKDGSRFWANILITAVHDETGKFRGFSKITRDLTETRRRTALMDNQRRVLEHIASKAPLHEVLETLVKLIEEQANELRCAILLVDPKELRLRFAAAPSIPKTFIQGMDCYLGIEPNMGSCGTAAYLRHPVYVFDTATGPLWEPCRDSAVSHGLRAIWSNPIFSDGGTLLGTVAMYSDVPRQPSPEDIQLIEMATQLARIAIQAKQGEEQLRALAGNLQSAREEERARIARELHDGLGQTLTAVKMEVAVLQDSLRSDKRIKDEELDKNFTATLGLIDNTIQDMRRITKNLHPWMLEHFGLKAAVEWQVEEFNVRTGIHCDVRCDMPDTEIGHDQAIAAYRIVQEALTNITRHAGASVVTVEIHQTPEQLLLRIADNGRGITVAEIDGAKSLGLLGMRERATLLGGRFEIEPGRNTGTVLTLTLPLPTATADQQDDASSSMAEAL